MVEEALLVVGAMNEQVASTADQNRNNIVCGCAVLVTHGNPYLSVMVGRNGILPMTSPDEYRLNWMDSCLTTCRTRSSKMP